MWKRKLLLAAIVTLGLAGCGMGNNRHQIRYEEYPWTKPYRVWIHTEDTSITQGQANIPISLILRQEAPIL